MMLATMWFHVVFIPLYLAGAETLDTPPGGGYGTSVIHADYTDSLLGALILSAVFGGLGALVSAAYWDATGQRRRGLRILLAVTAPLTVGVVWMLFVAPGATIRTAPLVRFLVELAVFTAASTGLLRRGRLALAADLGVGYAVKRGLIAVWDQ
jgi:hypothetical protein